MILIIISLLAIQGTLASPRNAFQAITSGLLNEVDNQCYVLVTDERDGMEMLLSNDKPIMEFVYQEVELVDLQAAVLRCGVLFYYPNGANNEALLFNNQTWMLWRSSLKVVIVVEAEMYQDQSRLTRFLDQAPPDALLVTSGSEPFDEYVVAKVHEVKKSNKMIQGLVKHDQVLKKKDLGRRQNFYGEVLTAQILEYFPFTSRQEQSPGFELSIVKEVVTVLGAEFRGSLYTYQDFLQGRGRVIGTSDLRFGSFYAGKTSEWPEEMSIPFWTDRECILARTDPVGDDWGQLVRPFAFKTWMFLLGSLIGVLVFLACLRRLVEAMKMELRNVNSILTCTLGPLLWQSGSFDFSKVRFQSLRMFFGVYLACCVILSNGFMGTLMSLIAIPGEGQALKSWQEVRDSGQVVSGQSYILLYLPIMDLELPKTKEIAGFGTEEWQRLADRKTFFLGSELFFQSSLIQRPETSGDLVSYYLVPECAASFMGRVYFNKPNRLKPSFDDVLTRLVESGIVSKMEKKWTLASVKTSADKATGLNIHNLWIIFALLAMFLASTTVVFLVEMMWMAIARKVHRLGLDI